MELLHRTTVTSPGRDLLALTKPGITLANSLMAAAGLVVAPRAPTWSEASSALVGTALVVAAANTFNMVLERRQDALMERTRARPIAAGRVSPRAGWIFGSLLASLGGLALLGSNLATALLGLAAVGVYAFVYTPMKRVTPWALHVGALAGAVPPLLGVMAVTPQRPEAGLALAALVFLWQFPHFLAIAVRRKGDYARAGMRTWPIVHGDLAARSLSRWTALLLVPLGAMPLLVGGAGPLAAFSLAALGAYVALAAWRRGAWERATLLASLAYLPALPLVLGLDRIIG